MMVKKETALKLVRYVLTGGISTVIDFGLNFLILLVLHLSISVESIISHLISFSIASIFGYFANTYWVFEHKSQKKQHIIFIKYFTLTVINTAWSTLLIWILIIYLANKNIFADENILQMSIKLLVGVPLGIASFFLLEKFVYEKKDIPDIEVLKNTEKETLSV